jgi:hypothetical protein
VGSLLCKANLDRLLVGSKTGVVVVTVVAMVMDNHHNLRLRRVGDREAKEENQREQNLFHNSVSRATTLFTELL